MTMALDSTHVVSCAQRSAFIHRRGAWFTKDMTNSGAAMI